MQGVTRYKRRTELEDPDHSAKCASRNQTQPSCPTIDPRIKHLCQFRISDVWSSSRRLSHKHSTELGIGRMLASFLQHATRQYICFWCLEWDTEHRVGPSIYKQTSCFRFVFCLRLFKRPRKREWVGWDRNGSSA